MLQNAPAASPKKLHIFKPGSWTTMAGEEIEFSDTDLHATARAYNPKLHKAPLVKGHPAIDGPAQGWATELQANGRGLFASVDQVDPAFAEEVRAGRYGTVSAKFYRPGAANNPVPGVWYLQHIGVLGAHPPAVKGLDSPEFAAATEDDAESVCFQEHVQFGSWEASAQAGLWRAMREWLISKFSLEEADQVVPGWKVAGLETAAAEAQTEAAPAFAEPGAAAEVIPTPPPEKEPTVDEATARQLREQIAAHQLELQQLRERETARQLQATEAEATAFAEGLAREARIPAAAVGAIAAACAHLQANAAAVEFGEGDAKQPLHAALRAALQLLPAQVAFGEQATRERAAGDADTETDAAFGESPEARAALDTRIRTYMAEHKCGYIQACQAVIAR